MTLTTRDLEILKCLRRYCYQRTNQLRDLVAKHDKDGSIVRARLRKLEQAGFVRRYVPKLIDPTNPQTAAPIFVLTLAGSNVLATMSGDLSLLLTTQPGFGDWMSLNHFTALASLHATIDAAVRTQDRVKQHALYFEHEVVQPDAEDPAKKFKLHVEFPTIIIPKTGKALKCCPDSAFETEVSGYRRAWYVEREMGSDSPKRVAAVKHKGYAELARSGFFTRHFPYARDFRVIAVCPNAGWREALRKEMKGKPGAELWLFCAVSDLKPDTFLHGEVFWTVEKGPLPFVPPSKGETPGDPSGAGRVGG